MVGKSQKSKYNFEMKILKALLGVHSRGIVEQEEFQVDENQKLILQVGIHSRGIKLEFTLAGFPYENQDNPKKI